MKQEGVDGEGSGEGKDKTKKKLGEGGKEGRQRLCIAKEIFRKKVKKRGKTRK